MNKIDVLDKGYVRLVDHMGSDLTVVNAARCSYMKKSEELTEKDIKLIKFLAREGHCYDEETEVLTDKGFVKWSKINKDSKLGAVCPKTGKFLGFEKPIDITIEEFNGDLIHFKTADVDLMVTEGHSIYCSLTNSIDKRKNPKFELVVCNKIIKSNNGTPEKFAYEKPMRMLTATTGNNMEGILNNIKDEMFSLYGFFIGDGCVTTKNSIVFHLKKENKIKFLKDLCNKLNINLKENENNNYVITEENLGEQFFNYFYNTEKEKTFPDWFLYMNSKQFEHFFIGLMNSDGSKKRNTWVYTTTSEELADKLQALASINGVCLTKNKSNKIYRLNVNIRRRMPRLNDNPNNKYKKVKYSGKVYCATVSTSLLIVRRNNKVVLCGNTSPFRHAVLQFEIYSPLMVARQWYKYRVGSAHTEDTASNNEVIFLNNGDDDGFLDPLHGRNEASRRYITLTPEFYIPLPTEWRSKPANSKQGSGANLDEKTGQLLTEKLINQIEEGMKNYEWALENNVAPEQARLFIPSAYGLYTAWYWTVSLQGICHFLNQRLEDDAQFEIREYAKAVYLLAKQKFPVSIEELVDEKK